jgi:DNA-binding response OmpR family regulator
LATVLAVFPGAHAAPGYPVPANRHELLVREDAESVIREAAEQTYDLLVLGGMPAEAQQRIATALQKHSRWRLVPVLYVAETGSAGIVVPGSYRPDVDSLAQGTLDSPSVTKRIRAMVREGVSTAQFVVAGVYELDQLRGRFRCAGVECELTTREAEVMAFLMSRPNRVVRVEEIISHAWSAEADTRHLQILRRHVSNIRRKLEGTPGARAIRTSRGAGYRFEMRHPVISASA